MHALSNPMNRVLPIAAAVAGLLTVSSARAEVATTGQVTPADTTTWTSTTNPYIGDTSFGSLTVNGGSVLSGNFARIGNATTGSGEIFVDGPGSQLNLRFYLGVNGAGTLDITNGEKVISTSTTGYMYAGQGAGGKGTITVDGAGSLWSASALTGLASSSGSSGTLAITNGGAFTGTSFYIGSTGTGRASVDGIGSNLSGTGILYVSSNGTGYLTATDGASVNFRYTRFGLNRGSTGAAIIAGAGTSYTSTDYIDMGSVYYDTGLNHSLSISDGASVSTATMNLYHGGSKLTVDVGKGSTLNVGSGTGTINNSGATIRLVTGADVDSGTYTPITYGTLTGTGTVQALGGKWDAATHTVTVSDAATAQAGEVAALDLSTTQRLLVTDASGQSVGLGFKGTDIPTSLSFSASPAEAALQAALQSLLAPGESVLSAWDFSPAEGYASGDPVYLSLEVGSGLKLTDLAIWHFDGSLWSLFSASDLAYDDQFASFTATGFSSYAVTAPVPVPAAVWLLGSALAGMGAIGRRKVA